MPSNKLFIYCKENIILYKNTDQIFKQKKNSNLFQQKNGKNSIKTKVDFIFFSIQNSFRKKNC